MRRERGLLFSSSGFSSNSAGWHGCGSDGGIGTVGDDGHAFRQLQFGSVDRLADIHLRQVNGQELWQVSWQAGDFDLVGYVADGGSVQFHSWRHVSVFEVQCNFHVQWLVGVNALEVSVQNQLLERVHLEVTQQHFLYRAVDFHVQDGRVESFFFSAWNSALWSRAMVTGASVPP